MNADVAQRSRPAPRSQPARRPAGIGPAPGRLELVRAFVNTLDIEERTDELGSPAALAAWLGERGLGLGPGAAGGDPAQVPPDHELRTAIALREALREVLLAHTGRAEPGAAAQDLAATRELDAIAARLPVRLEADAAGAVRPAPAGTGVEAGLAALLLIAAEAAATGTWTRLKVCGADDCRWAFYDRSPTRSGCWCSMAICGSRAKSRAFRRRSSIKAREPIQAGDLLPPCIAHKSPSKKVSGRLATAGVAGPAQAGWGAAAAGGAV